MVDSALKEKLLKVFAAKCLTESGISDPWLIEDTSTGFVLNHKYHRLTSSSAQIERLLKFTDILKKYRNRTN